MSETAPQEGTKILITGGAGFIGSTVASYCADMGLIPIILDDLSEGLKEYTEGRIFYEGDFGDETLLRRIIDEQSPLWGTIHCAAKIVVPESVSKPVLYYENNVSKSITLLKVMSEAHVNRFIFSSTGSMYDDTEDLYVDEESPVAPHSPYSTSKRIFEIILQDTVKSGDMKVISFRYFNPIGADPEFRTGLQDPNPSHVLGKMIQAHNLGVPFTVTGTDWRTRDGSGLRDYVHVWDIARAHYDAVRKFDALTSGASSNSYQVINLGTGTGSTVLELLEDFKIATGSSIEVKKGPRRPGDVVGVATRVEKARKLLGWSPKLSISQGIADSLKWSEKLNQILAARKTQSNSKLGN